MSSTKVKDEAVNHPYHYTESSIECIDSMRMTFGTESTVLWAIMTAYKYLWRRNNKANPKQDIDKAKWYLDYADKVIKDEGIESEIILDNLDEISRYYNRICNE